MKSLFYMGFAIFASACVADGHKNPYASDITWTLTRLNDAPFNARATLEFPEPGRISGQAPCNRFFGSFPATFPDFQTGALASTKMACPDLQAEGKFLSSLAQMTQATLVGGTLVLRGSDEQSMVFTSAD